MLRIKQVRESKHLSQTDLANMLGVSQQSISKYENGTREAGYDILIKMSEIFNVSINYLLGCTNTKNDKGNSDTDLSSDEKEIIDAYRSMNSDGKRILLGKALDLKLSTRSIQDKKKSIG